MARKVLLVGWDGADWKVINPLMDTGKMPNLARLVEGGVIGNLATLYPELSPMLWTSIATGKRPFKHGIHGFSEPSPGGGVQPITNLSRTTRALWNIMTLLGMKSNVVGWWPSHPAEPIDGAMVSDFYHKAVAAKGEPWPMRPGTIYPERLRQNLADLRVHPQDLDYGLMALFFPKLAEIDQDKDRRVTQAAKTIAECASICNAGQALMRHEPWTLSGVYFDSIDHFSHGFMNYHPPKLEWVDEKSYELYKDVVESGYRYHDILLGRLLEDCDDDTVVMLVSDHGFHSDHLRPRNLPDEPAGPAEQHRPYGVFAVSGPGIKKDDRVYGATLLDITPTILACLGLPIGEDMDGKALSDIFETAPELDFIPSWDDVKGVDGSHPKDKVIDPGDAEQTMRQLVELGYIEEPPKDQQAAVDQCVRELRYNLARSYMDADLHLDAVPLLEELVKRWPDEYRFGILLVNCYLALGRTSDASRLLDVVVERKKGDVVKARADLAEFQEENKEKLEKAKAGDDEALSEEESRALRKLRSRSGWNPQALSYLTGVVALVEGDAEKALAHLSRAERLQAGNIRVLLKLGDTHLRLLKWKDAERVFNRVITLDPENATGWLGLARAHAATRHRGGNVKALAAAIKSVGLTYFNPMGHYLLGICMHRAGKLHHAEKSLRLAVEQNPNFPEAHRRLAIIYDRLGASDKAEECRAAATDARRRIRRLRFARGKDRQLTEGIANPAIPENRPAKFPYAPADTVVVVSGLPRSGTSMMMQILSAGGLSPMSDGVRAADEDNPQGYWEHEQVKKLWQDKSWVKDACGKAVKVIANLLPALPGAQRYKVIFMWRDMEEILRSQSAMLRRGGHDAERDFEGLADTFTKQLRRIIDWAGGRDNIDILFVSYADAIAAPKRIAATVNAFLSGSLDEAALAPAVKPDLRRQRIPD